MSLKKTFVATFAFFVCVWTFFAYTAETPNPEVEKLDQQIEQLQDMKRGYEARALRHEDQAERLQFDSQAVLETRRHNQLAQENRDKADMLQKEIDRLQAEKKEMTKKSR